jgi:hypothetical protein
MSLAAGWRAILLGFIFLATAIAPARLPGADSTHQQTAQQKSKHIGQQNKTIVIVIKGTITSVENRMLAIIDTENKTHMLEVAPSVTIQIDGKEAKLQDLKKDQKVEIEVRSSDGQVRFVRAKKL